MVHSFETDVDWINRLPPHKWSRSWSRSRSFVWDVLRVEIFFRALYFSTIILCVQLSHNMRYILKCLLIADIVLCILNFIQMQIYRSNIWISLRINHRNIIKKNKPNHSLLNCHDDFIIDSDVARCIFKVSSRSKTNCHKDMSLILAILKQIQHLC